MLYHASNKKFVVKLVEPFFVAIFWPALLLLTSKITGLPITEDLYANTILFSLLIFIITMTINIRYICIARKIKLELNISGIEYRHHKKHLSISWHKISLIKLVESKPGSKVLYILPDNEDIDLTIFDDPEKIYSQMIVYCNKFNVKYE
ncbi:hypothetical protein HUI95_20260 [Aeromonas dhakensis]|uniref:hypothetical protein n=1 Tax=Aeromonas dhakensis TaxID=196024 RepID=UPI001A8CAA0B|nr:hypothetical protein [Aeromonas dhakensis]QSR45209.1 hypothetical protein HUI95_20260 [Aeromonas dhakensis]